MILSEKERAAFSLSNLIRSMASGDSRGSFELEVMHDTAQREGRRFDARKIRLPWELIARRDLSATGTDTGAYIVGNRSTPVADALRPWSVALQAGAQVLPNLTANVSIPRTATKQAAQWLAGEFDPLVASQPTLGQVSLTPKTCGALTTYTKLLEAINPQTEAFIASHLLRVIGTTVDAAILGGSGIAGQPQGIVGTAGVGSATVDSTYTWGDVTGMVQTVAENGSEPSAIVSTPAVRKLLQGRQRFTGGDSGVWSNAAIGDTRAYATTTCPTGKLIVGDFSQLVLAVWGSGVDLSIDAFTDWATGKITMRLLLSVDTGLMHPASFAVASVS